MPKTPHEIVTAFLIQNEPEDVEKSLDRVYRIAEKSKEEHLTPRQWNECKFDIEEIGFLLRAFSAIRQKVLNRLGVKMQGKSREEWIKEMDRLSRELYPEGIRNSNCRPFPGYALSTKRIYFVPLYAISVFLR